MGPFNGRYERMIINDRQFTLLKGKDPLPNVVLWTLLPEDPLPDVFSLFQPFGPVLNLIPMAESVVKLKAVCMICFKDAAFTKRRGTEKEV